MGSFDDLIPGGSSQGGSGAFDDLIPKKSSLARRVLGDTGVSALKGAVGLTEVPVGIADILTGGNAGKALEGIGYRPKEAKAALDEYFSPEQKAANQYVQEGDGFLDTVKRGLSRPSVIAQSVVESLPLLLPGAAAARGIGAATKAAPYIAGAAGEGLVGAGSAAEQLRQESEDGTISGKQTLGALASGVGTAGFGALGGKVASSAIGKKLGISDIDTVLAGGASNPANVGIAKRALSGAASEGVLEELPQSMWEQAAQNYATDKPLGEGVGQAGAMGLLAGTAMGGTFNAMQRGEQRKAVDDANPAVEETPAAAPLGLTYNANVRNGEDPLYTFPDGSTMSRAEYEQDRASKEQGRLDSMIQPADPEPKLQETGPMSSAVNVGVDSGATSLRPQGSFSDMSEFANLLGEEQQDVQSRRTGIAGRQALQREVALRDADQRVADQMAKEAAQRRRAVLDQVLSDPTTQNPADRFAAELQRQGFRDSTPTADELATVQRFNDIKAAEPAGPEIEPSLPNEVDAEQLGIRSRKGSSGAQSSGRDKVAEVRQLVVDGWKISNKTLVSPTGKKRILNTAEHAAAKEATRERNLAAMERYRQSKGKGTPVSTTNVVSEETNAPESAQMAAQTPQANDAQVESQPSTASSIKRLQAELEAAEFGERTELNGQLIDLVSKDAEDSVASGSMPVYSTGNGTFVAIHPSAQKGGMVQATRYSDSGVFGDSQYKTIREAVRDNGLWFKPRMDDHEATQAIGNSIAAEAEYQSRKSESKQVAPAPAVAQSDVEDYGKRVVRRKKGNEARDDLVGAIIRVTGGNGVAASMSQTITGDTANRASKVRGLFTNNGTMDLDDIANDLRTEEGYDVRDGNHLAELIREQAAGNPVYSMERNERDAAANEEKKQKDAVLKQANELGLKGVGGKRTLAIVEAEIAKEEARLNQLEKEAERKAIQAADAIDSAIGADMTEADFMRWLSDDIANTYTQEEIKRAEQDQADRTDAKAQASAIADAEEQAQSNSRQGNGNQPTAPQGGRVEEGARSTEGFDLTKQTNEQAAEQFAQQNAPESDQVSKEQVDRERDAVPFSMQQQSQPKPQGRQTGLFTADGRVSSEAKQSKQDNVLENKASYTPSKEAVKNEYGKDLLGNVVSEPEESRPDSIGRDAAAENRDILAASIVQGAKFATVAGPRKTGEVKSAIDRVSGAHDAAHVLAGMRKNTQENFNVLVLDENRKPISVLRLFAGSTSQASVFPEIVAKAVYETPGAARIWYAHNHPSGTAVASSADERLTKELSKAFGTGTGVTVDGHVIIAGTKAVELDGEGYPIGGKFDIPAGARTKSIQVTERTFHKTGSLGAQISSPDAARKEVARISEGKTGVVFLNAQNIPVAFLPMQSADMSILRNGRSAKELFGAAARSNASAAILNFSTDVDKQAAISATRNIYDALSGGSRGISVLDAFLNGESFSEKGYVTGNDNYIPGTFFSRDDVNASRGQGSGMAFRDLQAVVDRVSKGFNNLPKIHVLDSPRDLSDRRDNERTLKEQIEQAGAMDDVEGAHHNGEIYLFASGIASEERAEHVLATHEITHYGLRGTMGKGLDSALQNIWLYNKEIRAKATVLRTQLGLSSNVSAVEEVLAEMKDSDLVKLKGWRKMVQAFRDWAHKAGFDRIAAKLDGLITNGMSDQEKADLFVANMVNAARDWVRNGKPARGYDPGTSMLGDANFSAKKSDVTDTPAFRKWFGNSKVVDADGKPLVVYHGTVADFDAFENAKTGANDRGLWGRGHYFSASVDNANSYALRQGDGARLIPAYVSIKNPLILKTGSDRVTRLPDGRDSKELVGQNLDGAKIKQIALDGGHDGVIQIRPNGLIGDLVAYSPEQIKSATGNNGDFDASNPDIRFSRNKSASVDASITEIFDELAGRGLKKVRAEERLAEHPQAESIRYVQDNILDILEELEGAGTIKINC